MQWLREYSPCRQSPRLWVETLWLVESLEPLVLTREVTLRQGVNIVWAREPETDDAPSKASAGHSVGKTSFCYLLRYCLGDEAPSISDLCGKAAAGFPKGGVAARVHLDDVTWVVYRPYGRHGRSQGGRGDGLQDLLSGRLEGDFPEYLESLEATFIGRLPASKLPGSTQALEWRHLLAWCIRDQKTRFDAFFHWRDGDGLGFRRSRQDPPLFVRSVLGLDDERLDALMRDVETLHAEIGRLDDAIPELERLPAFELAVAERQLRKRLGALDELPIFRGTVGGSLEEEVELGIKRASECHERFERELTDAEDELAWTLALLSEKKHRADVLQAERGIRQSVLENNEPEFNRLSNELSELERLVGRCHHGDVEFSECEHILRRRTTHSMPQFLRQQAGGADLAVQKSALKQAEELAAIAQCDVLAQEGEVAQRRTTVRRLQMQMATADGERTSLRRQWNDYLDLRRQREEGGGSVELNKARERRAQLAEERAGKQAELLAGRMNTSKRGDTLKALTKGVASRMLGEQGYGTFNPDSDTQPFGLAIGGEAYQVLEVLLGDITTLLDSAISSSSVHPGFVVHDCPREADMSERLYREFLLAVTEAEEQLRREGRAPFQYILTTTSPPPPALREAPFLVLELRPGDESALLFKKTLVPELPGFGNSTGDV